MALFPQMLLDTHDELTVDLFAGGGGASCGFEIATGRQIDIAVNHDSKAVGMHMANHPQTKHFISDVYEVEPRLVTEGRPVGFLWASPDCTYHSKARGSKPIRDAKKKRRALAWVVTKWAGQVKPRVIMLENVEEFAKWGPLRGKKDDLRPCPKRKGKTFRKWVKSLTDLGYTVEWKERKAMIDGAPTIRNRLYLIARRDGQPIIWPEATYGEGKGLKPYRTMADGIDWSIPMCSIFATKEEAKEWGKFHGQSSPNRPLAEKTLQRIARGIKRYVLENPKPFIVNIAYGEGKGATKRWGDGTRAIDKPMRALVTKAEDCIVAPNLVAFHNHEDERNLRASEIGSPLPTVVSGGTHQALVASFMTLNVAGFNSDHDGKPLTGPSSTLTNSGANHSLVAAHISKMRSGSVGHELSEPLHTVTTSHSETHPGGAAPLALVAANLQRDFGQSIGSKIDEPRRTVTAGGGGHANLVASFLAKYYGTSTGQSINEPADTLTTNDRFGLVTVTVGKDTYFISDIAMRMLQPKELYYAQGFPPNYIIDRTADGTPITKSEQVKMCGNSVCPPVAAALVKANCPELIVRQAKGVA